MTEAVLDASVILKWLRSEGERHADAAVALKTAFEAGDLSVAAPTFLRLEILNVAGRRWRLPTDALRRIAAGLDDLRFNFVEPPLLRIAYWTSEGLTAYDAAYVAVAEAIGVPLITDDDRIPLIASGIAKRLGDWGG
jgi:predicted nucleic acid-binding protein